MNQVYQLQNCHYKLGVVTHVCGPGSGEEDAGDFKVTSRCGGFKAHMRPSETIIIEYYHKYVLLYIFISFGLFPFIFSESKCSPVLYCQVTLWKDHMDSILAQNVRVVSVFI